MVITSTSSAPGRATRRLLKQAGLAGQQVRFRGEGRVLRDPRRVQWWFHCAPKGRGLADRLLAGRMAWLVPGRTNAYGLGVYGATKP